MNPVLNYDFLAPQKIVFGWGRRREVGVLGRSLGSRAFLVSGLPEEIGKPFLTEIGDSLLQPKESNLYRRPTFFTSRKWKM